MPNLKSAKKRMKTDEAKRLHNNSIKSNMRTAIRSTTEAIVKGDKETADSLLNDAFSKIDRAAKKGLLHKNASSRQKAKLAKSIAAIAS